MKEDSEVYEGEVWGGNDGENSLALPQGMPMALPQGTGMVQTRTPYVAAMQVLKPRDMEAVEKSILRQATLMGEKAAYGWGAGKGRVEGISIRMAMIMFNAFGNMTIVAEPVQETTEAWIFTHYIVDLQTGSSAPRQWRESKRSKVEGNLDSERKDAIRFNRGQSKNIRNVIVNRIPFWLNQKVIEEARRGARDRLAKYIDQNGLAAAQTYIIEQLKRYGVMEAHVLEKMGKAELKGLDIDDLVMLKADLVAIESGEEHASTLFPIQATESKVVNLKDKIKATIEATTPKKADVDVGILESLKVSLGSEPFTWLVNDGAKEHLVSAEGESYRCNCTKPFHDSCLHVLAVQRFVLAV